MKGIAFEKWHGAGNDFIIIDEDNLNHECDHDDMVMLCHRRFGIGADGIFIAQSKPDCDVYMLHYNSDGSLATMCGNGARCMAAWYRTHKNPLTSVVRVGTGAGVKHVEHVGNGQYIVDMGVPGLSAASVPVLVADSQVSSCQIELGDTCVEGVCVSMGIPHTVIFDDALVERVLDLGPQIEHHPLFPKKTNVNFCELPQDGVITARVWERGCGETFACGTGACAIAVAAIQKGFVRDAVTVNYPGGNLDITWSGNEDDAVYMTGPAVRVASGVIEL